MRMSELVLAQVPYYNKVLNILWGGLWLGMLDVTVVLLVMQLTMQQQPDPLVYAATMTQVGTVNWLQH